MDRQITVKLQRPKIAFFSNQQGRHQTVHWTSFCQCDILHLSFVYNWIDEGNDLWCLLTRKKIYRSIVFIFILCSLRKQPIFCDDDTGFPPTEMTSVEQCRNSILIMTYYCPDLGSVSDWSKQSSRLAQAVRTATHIWVVIRHQCGISALFLQTSFCGETSFGVVICRLFSQAKYCAASKISC